MNESERETIRAIASLQATVRHLTETWQRQDTEAKEGRGRLHDKMDGVIAAIAQLVSRTEFEHLESRVMNLTSLVDQLDTKVTTLQPQAMEWNNHQQQMIGSKKIIALVWSAILVITSMAGGIVVKLVDIFWPPKH